VEDCSEKFHVYGVEWNKDSVKVSVDEKEYFKFANEHSGMMPGHLITRCIYF
jgi:Glycosyl hydrolases family 16.